MKAIIITPCLKNKIRETIEICTDDFVICADNSFPTAMAQGIKPDLIIGDFDTGEPISFPESTEVLRFPVEKDDADSMLCVKEASARGYKEITVVGGLSGRLDHTFANLQMLAYGKAHGLNITITDGENTAFMMSPGKIALPRKKRHSLSVFSYDTEATGISLSGVKYPLSHGTLTNRFPLGLSNEITGESAEIGLESGMLLVIISKLN
ncbi:MAG: thiamine diphosphokinase [Clostridia bacterium]|nr:thiamine diphosphokinase [Clostridia bacterium]